MKKLFILILLILFSSTSFAASKNELENEIQQVQRERDGLIAEQRRLEAELEVVNRESQTLGSAVKSLDATRRKIIADINVTQSKITSTNLVIRSLEGKMGEKETQIVAHRRAIAQTLQTLSQYDSRPLVLDLLSSAKFSDVWRDRSELESLNTKMGEEINALRETKKVLDQQKKQKERIIAEQASLKGQLSGQKSVVEESQKAKERLLTETKNKEAEYQKLLAENIAAQKQFEDDLFRLESQLRFTIDPSLIPDRRHGILAWPLDNIMVTQKFGDTEFARSGAYKGKGHNGVDFRASMGTPVKAALSGVVEGLGNTDEKNAQLRREGKPICGSYGGWVLIRHNNGLSTVYAHLSQIIVRTGQAVKVGDTIGYSGGVPGVSGSGYSTGPHLHLSLFASQGVEIRQFSSSNNCKHVSVPIADLRAYLNPLDYLPSL